MITTAAGPRQRIRGALSWERVGPTGSLLANIDDAIAVEDDRKSVVRVPRAIAVDLDVCDPVAESGIDRDQLHFDSFGGLRAGHLLWHYRIRQIGAGVLLPVGAELGGIFGQGPEHQLVDALLVLNKKI